MHTDTAPDARRVQIELFRNASVAERIARTRSLTKMVIGLSRRAIATANPGWTADEVGLKWVELHYGKQLGAELREHLRTRQ